MERMPVLNPKDQIYTVRMDKKLSEQFKKLAGQRNMKPSRLIRILIRDELAKTLPPEPKPVGRPRKALSELKSNVDRMSKKRADLSLYEQFTAAFKRLQEYKKELNQEIGAYILEEHKKGNLDLFKISKDGNYFTESDLSKTIEKMVDDF